MEERRQAPRWPTNIAAQYRPRGRTALAVRVLDLTVHGCRMEGPLWLQPDSNGWLQLPGIETCYARVAWHKETFAGLEFETALHEAVLHRLLERSVISTGKEAAELDYIADRARHLAREEESLSTALNLIAIASAAEGRTRRH